MLVADTLMNISTSSTEQRQPQPANAQTQQTSQTTQSNSSEPLTIHLDQPLSQSSRDEKIYGNYIAQKYGF